MFAFRSCGPGSIPTSGSWDFSAPCDIWWPVCGVHGLCFGHQDGMSRNNSVVPSRFGDESILSREICSRYNITHFYCLAVEAGFYSDVVECLPLDPTAQVRFPPLAVGIFLHPVTFINAFNKYITSVKSEIHVQYWIFSDNHKLIFLVGTTPSNILRKTIEGYLDSVRSLTSNTIKTLLIMHAFHISRHLQSKWMLYLSHASMV